MIAHALGRGAIAISAAVLVEACARDARAPASAPTVNAPTVSEAPALAVHVRGNTLVDARGRTLRLLGVDRAGAEYAVRIICARSDSLESKVSSSASVVG